MAPEQVWLSVIRIFDVTDFHENWGNGQMASPKANGQIFGVFQELFRDLIRISRN